ncbi:MAG: beta-lactamase family protein, partial [Anaerolineae bacterium]|nr:beta-lactamase family protein [Anaerolineae bacterium]
MKLANPEQMGFSGERLTRITEFMQRYVDEGKIAGFVTLVARKGNIVYFDKCGYQDIASKIPISIDTIFRIYSMTKPITSTA